MSEGLIREQQAGAAAPAGSPEQGGSGPAGLPEAVRERCAAARAAARILAAAPAEQKNAALEAMAAGLREQAERVLAANALDMEAAESARLPAALLDRLRLDPERLGAIARAVLDIRALADPVGEVIDGWRLPNGLDVRRVRVPLGVIAVVYEARPNVTIDAAALCLKAGNAIVLRGSSAARNSNGALAELAAAAAVQAGLPAGSIAFLSGVSREEITLLGREQQNIDLVIPRGGEQLKEALQASATVPVIYAAAGNCHVYVERSADIDAARRVLLNAKVQRPGVCNAAESLLVHAQIAERFLPGAIGELLAAGVVVCGDERTRQLAGAHAAAVQPAGEQDWATEYLDLKIAVAVVDSTEQAIAHIARYGSGHSEAILTSDTRAARDFQLGVDAACVYVNASTRFTDGGQFGMGAEIGNSTQKLHARGPLGLRELCTYKYLIEGEGHVRP